MKKTYWICCAAFVASMFILSGCTDARRSAYYALGSSTKVECYSGGQKVFEDESTGYVESAKNGLQYRSKTTNKHVRLYMDCIIVSD